MCENTETIRAFIKAWANLDAEELVTYFTDDGETTSICRFMLRP